MCQNPPFALSDMSALIDTNDTMGLRNISPTGHTKTPNKLIRQKKVHKRQTHSNTEQKDIQRWLVWHSMTAPRGLGVRMRVRLLRRDITCITVPVPTDRAHIARRRRRVEMLIGPIRARKAITTTLRQTVASTHEHPYTQKHEAYADGRDDYDRDLLFHKCAFDAFRRRRR